MCKYCAKFDKQNYINAKSHPYDSGTLITKSHILHNTKIITSAINEKKDAKKIEKKSSNWKSHTFFANDPTNT